MVIEAWVTIGLSSLLSLLALWFSWRSNVIARDARNDARAVAGLDVSPKLQIRADFKPRYHDVPSFEIFNAGPNDLVQVDIQFYSHEYQTEHGGIKTSRWGSEVHYKIINLPAWRSQVSTIDEHWLQVDAKLIDPPHHNVMEIRVQARRPVDLRNFVFSSFYYVNNNGEWVPEIDSTVNNDTYRPIKKAALEAAHREIKLFSGSDKIHRII